MQSSRGKFWLIILGILALLAFPKVWAQGDQLITVCTGSASGTYAAVFKDIKSQCSGNGLQLTEVTTSGGAENIDNAVNNKCDAFFAQNDTEQFAADADPSAGPNKLRVLVPLYPEEVHVVALKDLSKTTGGIGFGKFKVGSTTSSLNNLADLEGLKVGAWGGSVTTAQVINLRGSVHFDVVTFQEPSVAKKALDAGEIAAIIAVGGRPLGFVSGLDQRYKLLKIDGDLASRVKVYQPATVNYSKMGDGGKATTVSARSSLMVKNYTTPARRGALAALKSCIIGSMDEFKEGTGHHPKWSDVDVTADTSWPLYDAGSPASTVPVAVPKKK